MSLQVAPQRARTPEQSGDSLDHNDGPPTTEADPVVDDLEDGAEDVALIGANREDRNEFLPVADAILDREADHKQAKDVPEEVQKAVVQEDTRE